MNTRFAANGLTQKSESEVGAELRSQPLRTPRPHSYLGTRNDSDFLIMPPSIRPISAHFPVNTRSVRRDIFTLPGEIQRRISLAILTITVRQLAHKMRCVAPLCPCFSKVQTHRSRRAPNLTGQSVFFFCRKVLCDLENLHRKFVCELVNI